jgi:putative ABC transport system permease protein
MRDFFDTFLSSGTWVLLVIAFLVTVVAGVGILVSIYNSVTARRREIAILRALGATRQRVLSLICTEAGLIGLVGGILGFFAGHACGIVESFVLNYFEGQGIAWWTFSKWEFLFLAAVVVLAVLAGLVPALKAYLTPVADNLVSE